MNQHKTQNSDLWWGIDLKTGIIMHDRLSWLAQDYKLNEDSCFDLSEDLLQIKFIEKNIVLDVGWYKYNSKGNGYFKICLVKNQNWENILTYKKCRKINVLKKLIDDFIQHIDTY